MKGNNVQLFARSNINFLGNLAADPTGFEGAYYFNTVSNVFRFYNGTTWGVLGGGGGATAFTGLTDVPASYATHGQKFVKVNVGETGLEFVAGSGAAVAWGDITGTLSNQLDLQAALDGKQPLDADLTTIGGLVPSNDDIIQRKAGAWTNRTMAQLKTDLSIQAINVVAVNGTLTTVSKGTAIYIVTAASTQTLPTAVSNDTVYVIKNSHASANVTVDTSLGQTIDGSTSIILPPKNAVMIVSDNANWHIF